MKISMKKKFLLFKYIFKIFILLIIGFEGVGEHGWKFKYKCMSGICEIKY